MVKNHIGQLIKELRIGVGLTQKELSKNICTQAQISKIENGEIHPLSTTLFQIAQRLGVDLNYFFRVVETPRLDYVLEVETQIRKSIRERNYQEVLAIITNEKDNPLFHSIKGKQFFMWHEGICAYHLFHDKVRALHLLNQALNLTAENKKKYSEREIEILNSIGIIYDETKEYEKAISIYKRCLNSFKHFPILKDPRIKLRLFYSISKSLKSIGEYRESLTYSDRGINMCIRFEYLYLFGEFHYQKGINMILLGDKEHGMNYLRKAKTIFELERKRELAILVEKQISEHSE